MTCVLVLQYMRGVLLNWHLFPKTKTNNSLFWKLFLYTFHITFDNLHPNITMHILYTIICIFPKVLTKRICLKSSASFIDHLFHSCDLDVWFNGDIGRRNWLVSLLEAKGLINWIISTKIVSKVVFSHYLYIKPHSFFT